jgi:hypothetical protein
MKEIIKIVALFLGGFFLAYAIGFLHGAWSYNKLQKLYDSTVKECGDAWLSAPISPELLAKLD